MSECVDHGRAGDKDGYASTQAHEYKSHRNKLKLHRLMYCRYTGVHIAALDGYLVMHTCDNPRCINPEHLRLGTHKDNNSDRVRKGRFCGVTASVAKLDQEAVDYIRAHYRPRSKAWNTYTLAKQFGVSRQTISHVINFKCYKEQDNVT